MARGECASSLYISRVERARGTRTPAKRKPAVSNTRTLGQAGARRLLCPGLAGSSTPQRTRGFCFSPKAMTRVRAAARTRVGLRSGGRRA